jgi:hypothetical protein
MRPLQGQEGVLRLYAELKSLVITGTGNFLTCLSHSLLLALGFTLGKNLTARIKPFMRHTRLTSYL